MSRTIMTPQRFFEIKQMLDLEVPIREIMRVKKATRRTIRQIRDGEIVDPSIKKPIPGPIWTTQVHWDDIFTEARAGHPLKYIWEEFAESMIGYKAFVDQFHKKLPSFRQATVVHRYFEPGERVEVDYAGQLLEYIDIKSGNIFEVPVFIGALGFSHLMFATVRANAQSPQFLDCHTEMYRFFGGVPKITVPDCLKTGVIKCDLYDPEINPSYMDLSHHYHTAIVPARPRHPKDKAIVEGCVKLIMRYFNWIYRKTTFTSFKEINDALKTITDKINNKIHTRFKVSRYHQWTAIERKALSQLPSENYEYSEWKTARLHPDSYIFINRNYYSAPHSYRGQTLKVKLSSNRVEIFKDLNRIACHERYHGNDGNRRTENSHLPANARAYLEATPQNILSQSKFLNEDLYQLIKELFQENTLAHMRRAQGFISLARKEVKLIGHDRAKNNITLSIKMMKTYSQIRSPYFKAQLQKNRIESLPKQLPIQRTIQNEMLRHTSVAKLKIVTTNKGEIENASSN